MQCTDFSPQVSERASQQRAILAVLRFRPATTIELREATGVMHVAGRIKELRQAGHEIDTYRVRAIDRGGRPHWCALYKMRPEVDQ
jgi:hypothetical protein